MTILALYLLGTPRIERDNELIQPDTSKAVALLAYLAVTAQPQKRQNLTHLLWTGHNPTRARAALRRTLSTLKKELHKEWIAVQGESISLPSAPGLWTDVAVFQQKLAQCQTHEHAVNEVCTACVSLLTEATRLYQGEFLANFHPKGCAAFDAWRSQQAEQIYRQQLEALSRLVSYYSLQHDFPLAIMYGRQALALDPWQEATHRQLMKLYAWTKQPIKALEQYEMCQQLMNRELGITPGPKTVTLYEQIKRGDYPAIPLTPSEPPKQIQTKRQTAHLPSFHTPLIGREIELAELSERLQKETCHLLTIIGPGGVGKTRLAVQLADQHTESFQDGVFFVPLTNISSSSLFIPTIADALNFSFYGREEPQIQLFNYLHDKVLLLVLDNFEHLLEARATLLDLLKNAPDIKIVVTSRISLDFWAEWLYEVRGLAIPPNDAQKNPETYSAIQLFLHHIYRLRSHWRANTEDLQAASHICRLLVGLPLGIELAAVLARRYTCPEIAARITARLDTLATELIDIPRRHQSLRAVFDDSWSLLTKIEQAAVRRLAVFQGSFSLEAALAIGKTSPQVISALTDQSFLQQEKQERLSMHLLLRQYALEKLTERPSEYDAAKIDYGRYFIAFLQDNVSLLSNSKQQSALRAINNDIENVYQGWQWAVAEAKIREIEQALEGLYRYYQMTGQFQEGLFLLNQVLPLLPQQSHHLLRARILTRQAIFMTHLGQYQKANLAYKESLALLYKEEDRGEIAFCLNNLGIILFRLAQYQDAHQCYKESLALYKEIGNHAGIAQALCNIGNLYHVQGNYSEAQQNYEASVNHFQATGDDFGKSKALNGMALVAESLGDYAAGKKLLWNSLMICKKLGDRRGIVRSLHNLGYIAASCGEYNLAKQYYEDCLHTRREIGDRSGMGLTLLKLGDIHSVLHLYSEAAKLYREAQQIYESINDSMGLMLAQQHLGKVARLQKQHTQALTFLSRALAGSLKMGITAVVLETLLEIAACMAEKGEATTARSILDYILKHSASEQKLLKAAQLAKTDLPSPLPNEANVPVQAAALTLEDFASWVFSNL